MPYESYIIEESPGYIVEEDRVLFLEQFSLRNIKNAFENNIREISCEYRLKRPEEDFAWVVSVVRLITDIVTGDKKGILYVKNIDRSKRDEIAILNKVTCDEMTGVYNKGALVNLINNRISAESERGVFIMLDVDDFKHINDNFGHPVGDQVLMKIAQVLKEEVGNNGLVGRLGGDEFGIFIPKEGTVGSGEQEMSILLEKVNNIGIPGMEAAKVSCSMGVFRCEKESRFEEIYRKADHALYVSKKNGKKRVSFFKEGSL